MLDVSSADMLSLLCGMISLSRERIETSANDSLIARDLCYQLIEWLRCRVAMKKRFIFRLYALWLTLSCIGFMTNF